MGLGHLLVCKSKNFGSWVYQLMIQFIVVSSFFLQDYISFIFSLVFFFVVFFFGVVVFLIYFQLISKKVRLKSKDTCNIIIKLKNNNQIPVSVCQHIILMSSS